MTQDVPPSATNIPSPSGQAPLVVGLDLGGTKMAAALVDVNGALQGPVSSCPTLAHDGPDAMLNAISALVQEVATTGTHQDPGRAVPIIAVGVGTAGVVDVESGTILSATDAITGWAGTQVAAGVRERLAAAGLGVLPVHVENDVLMVAVGTGVGGALVIEGRTRRGAHHVAGEIAHVPVPGAQGEPCTCGRQGHLEAIAAGPQIHRRYLAKGGDPEVPDAREVERRADAGDGIAQEVYRDSAVCLARALAGLVTVIDPDVVVVSGGLARAGDLWWEPLRRTFAAEIIDPLAPIKIIPATLGTTAPIIGAARGALALAGNNDNHQTGHTYDRAVIITVVNGCAGRLRRPPSRLGALEGRAHRLRPGLSG